MNWKLRLWWDAAMPNYASFSSWTSRMLLHTSFFFLHCRASTGHSRSTTGNTQKMWNANWMQNFHWQNQNKANKQTNTTQPNTTAASEISQIGCFYIPGGEGAHHELWKGFQELDPRAGPEGDSRYSKAWHWRTSANGYRQSGEGQREGQGQGQRERKRWPWWCLGCRSLDVWPWTW